MRIEKVFGRWRELKTRKKGKKKQEEERESERVSKESKNGIITLQIFIDWNHGENNNKLKKNQKNV